MRKKHSTSEFSSQRNMHLLESFRSAIATQSRIETEKIFKTVAKARAPRFWVSEHRAAAIISKMLTGDDPTATMTAEKREMFNEIFKRFVELRPLRPGVSIVGILEEIVEEEAPSNYISWQRVRNIIYGIRSNRPF